MATNTERTVYVIELRDRFTRGMRSISGSTKRFNSSMDAVRRKQDAMTKGFNNIRIAAAAAAVYGIGRMITGMANLAGKFEEVRVAFNVMLGDKGLGGTMMAWAKEFSRSTVVTFDQTVTSLRKLLAYGISGQNARPLTEMLSTIAAGVGTDRLPYLTLALGQVFSRGRLMGTELRQFREHGVDIVSEIAKGMTKVKGRTVLAAEVEKMVTAGQISFDMVADSMIAMTQEGGRFHGMLEEASRTWPGVTAILKSTFDIFLTEAIDPFMVAMKSFVVNITNFLQGMREIDLAPIAETVLGIFRQFKDLFVEFSTLFGEDRILNFSKTMAGIITTYTSALDIVMTKSKIFWTFMGGALDYLIGTYKRVFGDAAAGKWQQQGGTFDMFGNPGKQADALGERLTKAWARVFELGRKPLGEVVDTGEFTSGGVVGAEEDAAAKAKKKRTNKLIGTGARDIIINIGNLIENVTNNNSHYDKNVEAMQEQLRRALLTVVNDVSLMAE